jgi:hypothetical protein
MIRALAACTVAAAALVLPAAAATPPQWHTITVTRHAGPITAVMSFQRLVHPDLFDHYRNLRLVVRNGGKTVVDKLLCSEGRCSPGSRHSLALQNVYGGPLDEAVMSTFTGGAHCCFDTVVALVDGPFRGRVLDHDFGDPGYGGDRRQGTYEFVTADDRFAYAFTDYAASALPVQVMTIDDAGAFADVTSTRLDLVRDDVRTWWRAYLGGRGKKDGDGDIRGVLAAWCADEYRLGEGAACNTELAKALKHGWLTGPSVWPQNAKFVAALKSTLLKWGYG